MNAQLTPQNDPLEGKILIVLIMTILVQFLYPLSIHDSLLVQVGYQLFYMSLFAAGIFLVSSNKRTMRILIATAVAWLIFGTLYAMRPDLFWANLVGYVIVIFYQTMLVVVLVKYMFRTRVVSRDVLLAACTIYLLLGAVFVPIYGIIEALTWFPDQTTHAFIDGVQGTGDRPILWQTFVYYSYATLTTLGYGDLLPATYWARSAATLEAVIGVLYTAVIVARLVGLYAAGEIEESETALSSLEPPEVTR